MKKNFLKSFCARCLTLLVLALMSTNLAWGAEKTVTTTFTAGPPYSANMDLPCEEGGLTWKSSGKPNSFESSNSARGIQFSAVSSDLTATLTGNYKICKFEVVASSNTAANSIEAWVGSTQIGSTQTITNTNNTTYTFTASPSVANGTLKVKFIAGTSGKSMYVKSIKIYYEEGTTPSKTLKSIAVSGTPTKTEYYVGDEFDPAGLVVTGTYDEGDPEVITSGITWNVTPSPLTIETISVSVTATVGDITSPEYVVNRLTVTEKPALPSYKLVTDASTLTAGDRILIVGTESDVYYALAPYVSGNNCGRNEVSEPVDGIIDTEVAHITLGGATGAWTLFDGTYYLYAAGGTGSNNYLKGAANADNNNAKWTISIANDGKATIKTVDATVARHTIRHNTGNDLFSCYASGQADVYIYKYEAKTKEVTITDVGWATVCLPFKATITSDNATAYYVTGTNDAALVKTEATVIPAGEGILLKSNDGREATVTFTISDATATDATGNMMKGSLTDKTFDETGFKYYILTLGNDEKVGFYWDPETKDEGASATCPAGKAVLAVPASSEAKAFFSLDNEPTGITSYENDNDNENLKAMTVYNLNGMKVNNSYKGIVIMNDKKYINK